jgi:polygalacturonase
MINARVSSHYCLVGLMTMQSRPTATLNPSTPPDFPIPTFPDRTHSVKDFGVTGDKAFNGVPAIHHAIKTCNGGGGGKVPFPAARQVAASIRLKQTFNGRHPSGMVILLH